MRNLSNEEKRNYIENLGLTKFPNAITEENRYGFHWYSEREILTECTKLFMSHIKHKRNPYYRASLYVVHLDGTAHMAYNTFEGINISLRISLSDVKKFIKGVTLIDKNCYTDEYLLIVEVEPNRYQFITANFDN